MNEKVANLSREARNLTPLERTALVEEILQSLESISPDIEQQWAAEGHERIEAYRRNELEARDLDDTLAKYHQP